VLSTLKYFRDEYVAHVVEKRCPARVCSSLLDYFITESCVGCGLCKKGCPASCISGTKKQVHVIDNARCIKCGTCISKCPTKSIIRH
jgi:NADH-quinone oxidoreductase subunit F/NADP-reducing hydrogenase subunit HndC